MIDFKLFIFPFIRGYDEADYFPIVAEDLEEARKIFRDIIWDGEFKRLQGVANHILTYPNERYSRGGHAGHEYWEQGMIYKNQTEESEYYMKYWTNVLENQVNTDKFTVIDIEELYRKGFVKELFHSFP